MSSAKSSLDELTAAEKRRLLARLMGNNEQGTRRFPLSFSQQRLWFLHQLSPGNPFYNVEAAIPISSSLDVQALRRAINEIVRRHEALRTTFQESDGQPMQVVLPALEIELPEIDLRNISPAARDAEVLRLRTEEAQRPYDLSAGPLLRTKLLRLGSEAYLFLFGMHHIVSDGWSMGIFGRELAACYTAFATGQTPQLPELPIQYGDFAVWQRKWLSGENLERQLDYWRNQLDKLSPLELPTDRPRPSVQTYRGAFQNFSLGKELTESLRELSKREGVTLFMTLLAAFKVLLQRYSGQEDIVVGTYIANRNRHETEGLIGFFLNTLVLRTDFAGDPTFRELLGRVREVAIGAYAHQDLPFEKLVEELHPARDLSRNPLFQVTFQLSNAPTQSVVDNPEALMDSKRGASMFDLACMLFETTQGLVGQIEYSSDLFDEATVGRMKTHLEIILREVAQNPEQRISKIPLLPQTERQMMLCEWNQTRRAPSLHRGLIEQFETQVQEQGAKAAFYCENRMLTYQELNERADYIACLLHEVGAARSTVIGVCMERSLEVPAALLGILKAGSVYLPLDPSYPPERLAYMLRDARAQILLIAGSLPGGFQMPNGVKIVNLLEHQQTDEQQISVAPQVDRSENDLAYVIYTSGSTGTPKGVAATYRQIMRRFEWMWEAYPFREDEVCCQKTALSFVDSIWELLGPLLQGRPTVIVRDRVLKDPHLLVGELAAHNVTRIWLVPSLLGALLDNFPDLRVRLPQLNFWVSSGEALSTTLLQQFRQAMPGATLYNLYGTSEVWDATWYDTAQLGGPLRRVPIGRPIDNVQVYVLDRHRQPVPIGVAGELYVAGDGLSEGYLNDHELTAEKFVRLPFGDNETIAYRTGDRARFLADGNIEYLNRFDDQVKLRGYRIEPAEIAAALLAQAPVLQEAAVIAHENGGGAARLTAYVVPRPQQAAPTATELRRFLQGTLPDFMIPASFVALEKLPLTPSGKLDRRALQSRAHENVPSTAPGYIAPRDAVEEQVVGIWAQLLSLDKISVEDNFFDLGGHSLLATQVMSRVQKTFGVQLPLQIFFEAPTVIGISEKISAAKQRGENGQPCLIPRLAREKYRAGAAPDVPGTGKFLKVTSDE